MAGKRRFPFMQFYPSNWRGDAGVRDLSPGARGFWIECMCLMHEAEPYGHLLRNGKPLTDRRLADQVTMTVSQVRRYRKELLDADVASVTAEGVLYSRRMVRDEEKRRRNRDNGKLGGNPRLTDPDNRRTIYSDKPPDNPSDKAHAREAQRLRDLEAQRPESTRTVGVGTSNGGAANGALRARAGTFCERYRWELHPELRGSNYVPSRKVEESDLDSAVRLCRAYDEAQLEELARFFLEIPEERDKFLKGKQRTLSMLVSMSAPIAEKLWGNHAGAA